MPGHAGQAKDQQRAADLQAGAPNRSERCGHSTDDWQALEDGQRFDQIPPDGMQTRLDENPFETTSAQQLENLLPPNGDLNG